MEKLVDNFKPQGGKHCITNSLKQIFDYYGYPLLEEMLFGIGEGLDFTYINLANAPMVSGRSKIINFEQTLSTQLGIDIRIKQGKDYSKVFDRTKQMIDDNHPVLAYVDIPFMSYFGMEDSYHFGGHSVVLIGYDDERQCFYVSDRDNSDYPIRTPNGFISEDYHLVPYTQMQNARSSNFRPFPANNKYAEFDLSGFKGISKDTLALSISAVCAKMLTPPAMLKGINGIQKFAKEIYKWGKFDVDKLKQAGAMNYFQINADGGTGGGIFRKMYGDFLVEATEVLQNRKVEEIGNKFILLSSNWDIVANNMWKLFETGAPELLKIMSTDIQELHDIEAELLVNLQQIVSE